MTIRYLAKMRGEPASPLVAGIFGQMRREFGAVSEPFVLQAPAPPILAAAWASLREGVLGGRVPRRIKETVAAVISRLNRCRYCVDAHTSLLHAAGGREAAWALRGRGREAIADPALRAAADWAAATRSPGAEVLASPPFGPAEAPEMIATAACFHYINRLATIFLGDTPFPVSSRRLAAPIVFFASRFFAPHVRKRLVPGESLSWLAAAPLPADLGWARPRPEIAAPFASLAAAVEDEAREPLGEGLEAVRARIAAWRGEDPPLGGAWLNEALAGVPERRHPAARLALLTALAPYRVGAAEVESFRAALSAGATAAGKESPAGDQAGRSDLGDRGDPETAGDRALVGLAAWASFTASRRITSWLDPWK
jgi:AhpD family alkylhydroperoxidase